MSDSNLIDPKKLRAGQLAALLGVAPQSIAGWDCPKNADGTYVACEVIKWRLDKEKAKVKQANTKQDKAYWDGQIKRLQYLEKTGAVVPQEDVAAFLLERIIETRSLLQGVSHKLSPLLVGQTDRQVIENLIDGELLRISEIYAARLQEKLTTDVTEDGSTDSTNTATETQIDS